MEQSVDVGGALLQLVRGSGDVEGAPRFPQSLAE
jgi:hypothetical protein